MASQATTLFFKNNRKYGIGSVVFDLILSETHNYTADVTEHPVEDGSEISDHIHNNPFTGTLNGLVTNYSLTVEGITTNRAQDVFNTLVALYKEQTLFTVTAILGVYKNIAITSMPFQRDNSQGESLPISVSFKQVNVVTLQEVELELSVKVETLDTDLNKQIAPEVEIGETSTNTPSTTEERIRDARNNRNIPR